MPPCAQRVEPSSTLALVTSKTRYPARRTCIAVARPAMPEPTTITSAVAVQPGDGATSRRASTSGCAVVTYEPPTISIGPLSSSRVPSTTAVMRIRAAPDGGASAIEGSVSAT